jgi:hypothetical protein
MTNVWEHSIHLTPGWHEAVEEANAAELFIRIFDEGNGRILVLKAGGYKALCDKITEIGGTR